MSDDPHRVPRGPRATGRLTAWLAVALAGASIAPVGRADLELPALFQDGMVLLRVA